MLLSGLIVLLVTGVPIGYSFYSQSHIRNFHMVREGVLYRSGQMSVPGLQSVIRDHGIKTVVSLRPADEVEEAFCRNEGINYYRISPRPWEGVPQFLEIMDDPELHPILIHCYAGIHRTGAYSAIYRMEYEHWSNEQAIAELRARGYTALGDEWNLLEFLEQYQPRWRKDPCLSVAPDR
jgi:protein tyrosine/serine phosphatase